MSLIKKPFARFSLEFKKLLELQGKDKETVDIEPERKAKPEQCELRKLNCYESVRRR